MKQNSTKNMIIRHLKDIKAKIEQKSINNIKLQFEGPFNDKCDAKFARDEKLFHCQN